MTNQEKGVSSTFAILKSKYENSTVVALSALFVFLTLCNMFVMYRLLLDVIPYPIGVTWMQLVVGLFLAFCLGGFDFDSVSKDAQRNWKEYFVPVVVYLLMICTANVLLKSTPVVAVYPSILALAVVLHHLFRWSFSDQKYLLSWNTVIITALAYVTVCLDSYLVPPYVLLLSILYAFFSASFRALCLEKALHITERDGNKLYNIQVFMGVILLFFSTLLLEPQFFTSIPTWSFIDGTLAFGCLVTVGTIPFAKNVVANKLVTLGQQAPWRFAEIVSVLFFFIFGSIFFQCSMSIFSLTSFCLVLSGRFFSMVDIVSNECHGKSNSPPPAPVVQSQYSYTDTEDAGPNTSSNEGYTTPPDPETPVA